MSGMGIFVFVLLLCIAAALITWQVMTIWELAT